MLMPSLTASLYTQTQERNMVGISSVESEFSDRPANSIFDFTGAARH